MNKRIELLAPAGDLEKLKIAVMYGADAVFVGTKQFSLRTRASNFTVEDLEEGAKFCHKHHAKLYVTVNILPHNEDLIGLVDYLQELEKCGVDAIIVSSYAVLDVAKKHTNLEIHISTQQSVSNSLGVKFYEEFGATRVVLARELSLKEIEHVRNNSNIELEVFIHGGMCSSYSGRCMLSNHMTNRDANRGGCAHSCRWNYDLYNKSGDNLTKISDEEQFQFASKDLCSIREIPELIGICDSLKIEGRMKSLHYIATVVNTYRREIDEYLKTGKIADFDYYFNLMSHAENRIFANGFLDGNMGPEKQLYNMRSEQANQEFVGIVLGYDDNTQEAKIDVRNFFSANATLEIFCPKGKLREFSIDHILNDKGELVDAARHPRSIVYIKCPYKVKEYDIIRVVQDAK